MISYEDAFRKLLTHIVSSNLLHARWLNTLSYLENCGARKIAACEHPTLVKEEMLKHAAEEFRHAYYLKRQITRITTADFDSYTDILGSWGTRHYLHELDIQTARYLAKSGFSRLQVREAAYLLVTYAIELRAHELYPIYDEVLRSIKSPVAVKSIVLEEKEHLEEMKEGLKNIQNGFMYARVVTELESRICKKWLHSLLQILR